MEKKEKSLCNTKTTGGRKGTGLHRRHGSVHRSSSFGERISQLRGEPLDKISEPKSKRPIAMRRPKTHTELLDRDKPPWLNLETPRHSTNVAPPVDSANNKSVAKLLVNVTVAQSIGPLRVLLSSDATVLDAIKATLAVYAKEGRRPILSSDPLSFGLHYSQFTIDCLNPNDKMKALGCRNFFMCPKKESITTGVSGGTEMEKFCGVREPFYNLMNCFLAFP